MHSNTVHKLKEIQKVTIVRVFRVKEKKNLEIRFDNFGINILQSLNNFRFVF